MTHPAENDAPWRPLRHRLQALIEAYEEESHSDECGMGACVRCVVDEFEACVSPPAKGDTPTP